MILGYPNISLLGEFYWEAAGDAPSELVESIIPKCSPRVFLGSLLV